MTTSLAAVGPAAFRGSANCVAMLLRRMEKEYCSNLVCYRGEVLTA